ncbi:hypothetical protein V494_07731 [Pseudogymnoascus sp. VKM F-4513 (FW-928)]|nr:hypothetical protein V494_07731 [Pseudogymnoascus sp. VKM F-4513 (FW-928)]
MWIHRYVLGLLRLALSGTGQTAPGPVAPKSPALYHKAGDLLGRADSSTAAGSNSSETAQNFWKLSKRTEDIEAFRKLNNLILVESTPLDAAFMPSWPQALVQYILINPPINCFKYTKP